MTDNDPEVRLGYSSYHNISFKGTVETGIPRSEWNELTEKDKDEVIEDSVWDLIDIYELADDEPDVY